MNVEILEEDLEGVSVGIVDQESAILVEPVSSINEVVGLELTVHGTISNCSSDTRWIVVGETVVGQLEAVGLGVSDLVVDLNSGLHTNRRNSGVCSSQTEHNCVVDIQDLKKSD